MSFNSSDTQQVQIPQHKISVHFDDQDMDEDEYEAEYEYLLRLSTKGRDFINSAEFRLQRPAETAIARLMQEAAYSNNAVAVSETACLAAPLTIGQQRKMKSTHLFLVEHDWAQPLAGSEAEKGDVIFPYDNITFEFVVSDVPVFLMRWTDDGRYPSPGTMLFVEIDDDFVLWNVGDIESEPPLVRMLMRQAESACTCLEANVATAEARRVEERNATVDEPAKLRDYHVVKLAHAEGQRAAV